MAATNTFEEIEADHLNQMGPGKVSSIVLLTNDNLNSLLSIGDFLAVAGERIPLVIVTTRMPGRGKPILAELAEIVRGSGFGYLVYKLMLNAILPVFLRPCRLPVTVTEGLRIMGVHPKVIRCASVNTDEVRRVIAEQNPDVLLSMGCSSILGAKVLGLAKNAAVNTHPSLLPKYAGTAPAYWTVANGDPIGGVTTHLMLPKVDAGAILEQRQFDLTANRSVLGFVLKAATAHNQALMSAFQYNFDPARALPQNLSERTYCVHPTREDVRRFKKAGKQFWTFSDLRMVFSKVRTLKRILRDLSNSGTSAERH